MVKVAISILSMILAYLLLPQIVRSLIIDKYEWLPTESAHHEFPMTIIDGNLVLKDGSSIYVPATDITKNGWGELGSTHVVGSEEKALPVRLAISWFSYAEDKFFKGNFELPYEQVSYLFSKGRISAITGEKITFQRVMVGLAPAGEVSVWLTADGEVLHVASFTAKETDVEWSQITENETYSRTRYVKDTLKESLSKDEFERLEKEGVRFEKLAMYEKQYMWDVEVLGQKTVDVWLNTYNGEMEYFGSSGGNRPRSHRAQPKELEIVWEGRGGNPYSCKIKMDTEEVLKGYAKLSAGDVNYPMHLRVEISDNNQVAVSLRDNKYILPLNKTSVSVYNAIKYW